MVAGAWPALTRSRSSLPGLKCGTYLPGSATDYDYFRITAGPLTLGARYRGRAPSKSRIERPLSGHRSLA